MPLFAPDAIESLQFLYFTSFTMFENSSTVAIRRVHGVLWTGDSTSNRICSSPAEIHAPQIPLLPVDSFVVRLMSEQIHKTCHCSPSYPQQQKGMCRIFPPSGCFVVYTGSTSQQREWPPNNEITKTKTTWDVYTFVSEHRPVFAKQKLITNK